MGNKHLTATEGVRNDDVLRIVEGLNKCPRKCLGFRIPRGPLSICLLLLD